MQGAAKGAELTRLEPSLEELLKRHAEQPVFLHPAWLRTWLSEFGLNCEPIFLSARNGDLLGVAPLMRTDDSLTFIGDASICDFMDVLVDPANADAAYAALWDRLCAEGWSEVELWGLMASSPTRKRFAAMARDRGYRVEEELEAVSPRVLLPATWEAYLASLSKKDRHELRRKIRRVFESGAAVDFDVLTSQDDVVAAMGDFLDLHTRSRQDKTEFMTAEMAAFFRRMASALAAEGLVRLFMLRINRRPAASVLCFDAGNCLYMYNSGYDPEFAGLSVGLVSKALCLRWAIENGLSCVDFLRGNEAYKYDLGARDQEIYRLRLSRPA
ncbi:MAG TPA: GNAT family N-acetyltransferase [Dehalococcoidia bacterium]|nr:GNAT family N-acetyltransferase [Dehalococcoidia bacterium]